MFLTVWARTSRAVSAYLQEAFRTGGVSGCSVGSLADGGTELAPFHSYDGKVSTDLRSELRQVEQGILAGKIEIRSPS